MVRRAIPATAVAVLSVALLLRSLITSVPPALPTLRVDLELGPALAGLTTSLPLVCFGVFAFAAPALIARFGLERSMLVLLVPLAIGTAIRSSGGGALFFLGTVLIGCGVALGNVLVPTFIRSRFPLQMALLMGWYTAMLQISGAAGSVLTVPLEEGAGWGWRAALGVWLLPVLLVLAVWVAVVRRTPGHDTAAVTPPSGFAEVARVPRTWLITAFMGLQSWAFYSLVTWLPDELIASGLSATAAGVILGLFSILGLPGAFIAPRFATSRFAAPWIIGVVGLQIVSVALLGVGPVAAVIGALLCGLAQGGSFSSALTFIADQPHARDVPAISALAQGTGYVVAAIGPVTLGALFAATGGWTVPNLSVIAVLAVVLVLGTIVGPRLHRANLSAREQM